MMNGKVWASRPVVFSVFEDDYAFLTLGRDEKRETTV